MRIFSILVALALLILPAGAGAQCSICIGSSSKDDGACPLRSSGPLSKADIKDASDLLTSLDSAKTTLNAFRDVSDSADMTLYSRTKERIPGCQYYNGYGECTMPIVLGTAADVRDMVTNILKGRIEKATCRLRAIGVDVPKP